MKARVEARCLRRGIISPLAYCDILQGYLTPCQKAGVVERLEMTFSIPDQHDQQTA